MAAQQPPSRRPTFHGDFVCPKCDGRAFYTLGPADDPKAQGCCKNHECGFTWLRSEDDKVFR